MRSRRPAGQWNGGLVALALLALLSGCVEEPQMPPPPPPPTRPVRVTAPRPRPVEPPRVEATDVAPVAAAASPQTEQAAPPAPERPVAAAPPREEAPHPVLWRVVADRTIGCAVPETVTMLRSTEGLTEAQPRLAAQARRDGRCSTTFRVNEWIVLRIEGELVLLRLANPPPGVAPLELYFMRRDVMPMASAAAPAAG